jgi:hypothetical protein
MESRRKGTSNEAREWKKDESQHGSVELQTEERAEQVPMYQEYSFSSFYFIPLNFILLHMNPNTQLKLLVESKPQFWCYTYTAVLLSSLL